MIRFGLRFGSASLATAALVLALVGCGGEPPPEPRFRPHSSDARGGSGSDTAGAGDDGADAGDGSSEGSFGGDDGATTVDVCADLGPETERFQAQLNALPYTRKGSVSVLGFPVSFDASVSASLALQSDGTRSVSTTAATVRTTPERYKKQGDDLVKKRIGTASVDLAAAADRSALLKDRAWSGVACLVQPGRRLSAAMGGGTFTVSLEPPLPTLLSPKGTPAAYAAMLGAARRWDGVVATVVSSTDPSLPQGTTKTGTAILRAIDREAVVAQDGGTTVNVGGDVAFELALDFGGPEATAALGLAPATRYFIDTEAGAFKAIVVETGEAGATPVVFVGAAP